MVNISHQLLVLHLLAKHGRLTSHIIFESHLASYPELASRCHIKKVLGNLVAVEFVTRKPDQKVINPKTKGPTWFCAINPELKPEFEDLDLSRVRTENYPRTVTEEPVGSVPLLGRTGPYSDFRKYSPKGFAQEQIA